MGIHFNEPEERPRFDPDDIPPCTAFTADVYWDGRYFACNTFVKNSDNDAIIALPNFIIFHKKGRSYGDLMIYDYKEVDLTISIS